MAAGPTNTSAGAPRSKPFRYTASVVGEWVHPAKLLSETQGDTQMLPGGNVFIGWGSQPAFSEFTADGKLLFDGRIAEGNDNYRAYRGTWAGRPATTPSVVVEDGKATVSWNGATDVARWQLLAGPRRSSLQPDGTFTKKGFETTMPVPADARFVAVRAQGPRGRTLSESAPVEAR